MAFFSLFPWDSRNDTCWPGVVVAGNCFAQPALLYKHFNALHFSVIQFSFKLESFSVQFKFRLLPFLVSNIVTQQIGKQHETFLFIRRAIKKIIPNYRLWLKREGGGRPLISNRTLTTPTELASEYTYKV